MTFHDTRIPGVHLVDADVFPDERGAFVRAWRPEDFAARGLETRLAQASFAVNRTRGTIRGLHYQTAPFEEVKLIRVVRGAIYDVALDLRRDSPTHLQWVGVELAAGSPRMLYVPRGCAHGYQTLADDTEVFYLVSTAYAPAHQAGARWNDPAFGIAWPLGPPAVINARDATYPDYAASVR
jgi:dTDP-4-dehydrorhamnose 3,5-epimerase